MKMEDPVGGLDAACVILAAGGRSDRLGGTGPRVLQEVCGVPALGHVLDAAAAAGARDVAVVAGEPEVEAWLGERALFLNQSGKFGSGYALMQALEHLRRWGKDVFVIYGDRVYLEPGTLESLRQEAERAGAAGALLSVVFDKPHGNGRVVRKDDGTVLRTVTDCTIVADSDQEVREVVAGAYFFRLEALLPELERLKAENGEECLMTDVVTGLAAKHKVAALRVADSREAQGIYSYRDLASAHAWMQERLFDRLMSEGVRIVDPRTTSIDADVRIGTGTVIFPHTVIEGPAEIGKGCRVGPFARIRAGVVLGDDICLDDFVDIAAADAEPAGRA